MNQIDFRDVEQASHVTLNGTQKTDIQVALEMYVADCRSRRQVPVARRAAERLREIRKSASGLSSLLDEDKPEARLARRYLAAHMLDLGHDSTEIASLLDSLSSAAQRAGGEIRDPSRDDPDVVVPLHGLIRSLERVFTQATGTRPSVTRDPLNEYNTGVFFKFVEAIFRSANRAANADTGRRYLPVSHHALAESIRHALQGQSERA